MVLSEVLTETPLGSVFCAYRVGHGFKILPQSLELGIRDVSCGTSHQKPSFGKLTCGLLCTTLCKPHTAL